MMKGGARVRLDGIIDYDEGWCASELDLDEGWCEPLHYMTIQ